MITYDVYGTDDNWLYSDGVTRAFGVNRIVRLDSGENVLCSVQPLSNLAPDAVEKGWLKKVGTICNESET